MKKIITLISGVFAINVALAQFGMGPKDTSWKQVYRAAPTRINNLVHTKLEAKLDFEKAWLYGRASITLQPHFYPTDSLSLDAKGMQINEVSLLRGTAKAPLKFGYDGMVLKINLDKTYRATDKYTVFIDYVAKPNELQTQGSAAIRDAKGLYFINPRGEDKNKPTQVWTQGETEATSVWCPTIDKTNQKTTQEIHLTVPSKFVTLSNGVMVSQKKNADGTRTDYWKMDLPHAPYLFFIGAGDFAVVKDNYKGKEVSYYVDKKWEPVARKIFGETPAMMAYFEKILGVPFPWQKYAQMVATDYVSGAMENTTATLHGTTAYQDARQLTEENSWEHVIAHELFHHWFGDLVTAESWSNLTVNESYANYSEYLWNEFKHGKDFADDKGYGDMVQYLSSGSEKKELVRFHYADKEDMFDLVSYNKGGSIIHMLRNYVGDEGFFKSLNKYLTDNKFKAAEATHLRLAFEEVTGKDLNWFFNQLYFGSGHPKLKIDYIYDQGRTRVIVEQTQKDKIFKLPVKIDMYNGLDKQTHQVWVTKKMDTFSFATPVKPDLVNFDADKVLLAEKVDNKTAENYVHQWKYATKYMDRYEALQYFNKNKMPELALGIGDRYAGLREYALSRLLSNKNLITPAVLKDAERTAQTDPSRRVKARALELLASTEDKAYSELFRKNVTDSSYSVAGAALDGLRKIDPDQAYQLAKQNAKGAKGKLSRVILDLIVLNASESDYQFMSETYANAEGQTKLQLNRPFAEFLEKVKDESKVREGVKLMMDFRNEIPEEYRSFTDGSFRNAFNKLAKAKTSQGQKELAEYIEALMKK
jgi:aminopeptidase N